MLVTKILSKSNLLNLEDNQTEIYKASNFKDQMSNSTFYKYLKINGEFKKPYRWTDFCDYCEYARKHRKK